MVSPLGSDPVRAVVGEQRGTSVAAVFTSTGHQLTEMSDEIVTLILPTRRSW